MRSLFAAAKRWLISAFEYERLDGVRADYLRHAVAEATGE